MKLWEKNISTEEKILSFTTGMDPIYDLQLASHDILGSMAHVCMLAEEGLMEKADALTVVTELKELHALALEDKIRLDPGVEDIHSQVEMLLTTKLGDLGKRIHTGRSRNDQVMVDIKLFLRDELEEVIHDSTELGRVLLKQAELTRDILMPGYTHMQVAMPSSFGLWFGAYAEALADDLSMIQGIYSVVNQNPLGSAAGFGSSFPINRELTTSLLGFEGLHLSSVNAQMNRGKTEWYVATGLAALASTMGRMAMDAVLFMGQNFRFFTLPAELTTGSSIMPHKKNPDVLELIRAHCNRLSMLPAEVSAVTQNLISGYHRDFQVLKEVIHPALASIKECIFMLSYVMERVEVNSDILNEDTYEYLFTVEEVNRKVVEGMPFRDAYREVADEIDQGRYRPGRDHNYTHTGSIGNPGTDAILEKLEKRFEAFHFVDTGELLKGLTTYFE